MTSHAQKLKLLYLARLLEEETDDEHGLTGPQIIERLTALGVSIERKTLYKDIDALIEYGYDIQKYQRSPVEYGLASRPFQDPELMLLADAVQSSKFLTKSKSDSLVRSIGKLGSKYLASELKKHLHVEGRIRSLNESAYYNIDAIQRAMNCKRKVEFYYYKYDENKKKVKQHGGDVYCETPVQLVYRNDFYYLITFNDKHQDFTSYRVDRMMKIKMSAHEATRNKAIAEFDVAQFQERAFGMFSGRSVAVTLLVDSSAMSAVVDCFGSDVVSEPAGEGKARVHATVMESPTFFGWMATLGTEVLIESPASLKESYANYLQGILDDYR